MIVLTYRGRTLEVSGQVLKTFQEMEITREAKVQEKEGDAGDGKPKAGYVTVEGIKADSISFEVLLSQAAGVDVLGETMGWRALVDGKFARLYIAGKDMLGMDMALTGCGTTQMQLSGAGEVSQAKLKLTFAQAGAEKKKRKGKTKTTYGFVDWSKLRADYASITKGATDNGKTFQSVFTPPPKE